MNDQSDSAGGPGSRGSDARSAAPAQTKGDNEYEPNDSRNVTGTARTDDGRWSGDDASDDQGSGEYEPRDSRNVTGTAKTEDGRWTNDAPDRAPGDN